MIDPAEVFLEIAQRKGCLDAAQAEALREAFGPGGAGLLEVERLCVRRRYLDEALVRRIDRAVHYYVVRRADKLYGRIAIERGFIDEDTVQNCLKKQRRDYERRRTLVRLSKLLAGLEAITPEQDEAVRVEVVRRLSGEQAPASERRPQPALAG